MTKIKVVLAEDSGLMRLLVSNMINEFPDIEIVGSAQNGKEAVERVMALEPDVLLLDLNMPLYDGIFAIKELNQERPTPTLILSASTETNDFDRIHEALSLGAFDYLAKPVRDRKGMLNIREGMASKIRAAARFDPNSQRKRSVKDNTHPHVFPDQLPYDVIVVGASTGGPTALENLVRKLPANLPVPVIIAQHIPARFVESLARRLNALSEVPVVVSQNGDPILGGRIYLASGHFNLKVERKNANMVCFGIDKTEFKEFNNPSVNALFLSAAKVYQNRCIALQLTGMGRDGVIGLEVLGEKGAYIVAQDEASCVVFGMPGEAIKKGLTNAVVSITEMGGYVVSCLA